jgi:hypothetical protein
MIDPILAAWICICAPLAGAAATPLLARVSLRLGGAAAVAASLVAAAAALRLAPFLLAPEALPIESRVAWLDAPIAIDFGISERTVEIHRSRVMKMIGKPSGLALK